MAVVDVTVRRAEDRGWYYGRFRIIRRGAAGDPMEWRGPAAVPASRHVWSWRTASWPGDKITRIANVLNALEARKL